MRAEDSVLGPPAFDDPALGALTIAAGRVDFHPPEGLAECMVRWADETPEVLERALELARVAAERGLSREPEPNFEQAIVVLTDALRRLAR